MSINKLAGLSSTKQPKMTGYEYMTKSGRYGSATLGLGRICTMEEIDKQIMSLKPAKLPLSKTELPIKGKIKYIFQSVKNFFKNI